MLDLLQTSRGRSRGAAKAPPPRQVSGDGRGRGLLAFGDHRDLTTPPRPADTCSRTEGRRTSVSEATDAGARITAGAAGLVSIHYKGSYNEYLVI